MPLFALLCPSIITTTNDRIQVEAQIACTLQEIRLLMICDFSVIYLNMSGLQVRILCILANDRLEHHASVLVEECENHVEMNERLWSFRQFLNKNVELGLASLEIFDKKLNTFLVGSDSITNEQSVVTGNQHIATFGACSRLPFASIYRLAYEIVLENSTVDDVFAHAHLKRHCVHQ